MPIGKRRFMSGKLPRVVATYSAPWNHAIECAYALWPSPKPRRAIRRKSRSCSPGGGPTLRWGTVATMIVLGHLGVQQLLGVPELVAGRDDLRGTRAREEVPGVGDRDELRVGPQRPQIRARRARARAVAAHVQEREAKRSQRVRAETVVGEQLLFGLRDEIEPTLRGASRVAAERGTDEL